jgi:hypothetical protein
MTAEVSEIMKIIQSGSREKEADVQRICELSKRSLDNYSQQDRVCAWLCMLKFLRNGFDQFHEKAKELLEQYKDYCNLFEVSDWHFKRFPSHFPSRDFGLKDNNMMATIHGDIVRTGRLIFFLEPLKLEKVINHVVLPGVPEGEFFDEQDEVLSNWEQHIRRIERVLYVFATLNTGMGYMQGFNELVFPFYYVLMKGISVFDNDLDMAECMCFNMFQWLLTSTSIYDFYTTLDHSIIMHNLDEFVALTKKHVPVASKKIQGHNLHPLLYCHRWFKLLFAQEHELPYLLGIWDSLLAHSNELIEYSMYLALGHLKLIENKLDAEDYTTTVKLLQNMDLKNQIRPLLEFAEKCWEKDHSRKSKLSFFNRK